jgi:hypothetical protein
MWSQVTHGEVTVIKKKTAQLRAFQNFDQKIAQLEDYSVTYVEKDHREIKLKSAPARQAHKSEALSVELLPAKKKS